ncbi:hypothetical protein EB796_010432 [Bugula neritina]|uniref:BRCT domain-containing protein n=1 Tax=Bugula neritina TaxID=10212 RepID=A0A7J7K0T8_BUGNE|nr:hypothetical protein EB796_010432 [Bugula neritina]
MSEVEGSTLFSSLQYYIAGKITPEAQEILDKGAAKSNSYLSELVKISITDTTDNEDEYSEITDIYDIPVVSCDWVILSHKCGKLLPTKPFPPKQTSDQLFANKVFAASHVERSDLDSLWAMITFHGGSTQRSMTENVTHLLCTDTKGKKYGLSENKFKVKVVTPDWVLECVRAKKLISEIEYHPKLLVNSSNMLQRIVSPAIPLATAKVTVPISSTTASQPTTPSSVTFPTISDYPLPPPAKTTSKSPVHRKKATPKASQPSPSPMISPPPVDFHSGLSHVAPGYLQQPRFTPPPTTMPPLSNAQQPLRSRQVSPQFLSHMGQGTYSPNPPHPEQQSTQVKEIDV